MSKPLTLSERAKLDRIRRDHASDIDRARAQYDVEDDGYYRGVGFGLDWRPPPVEDATPRWLDTFGPWLAAAGLLIVIIAAGNL